MPTLIRLIVFCLFLVGLLYGGSFLIVWLIDPPTAEVVHSVPKDKLSQ